MQLHTILRNFLCYKDVYKRQDLTRQLYTVFENAEVIFGVSGESILNDVQPFHTLSPEDYEKACSEYFSHPGDKDTISDAFHKIFSGKSATYQARMKAGNSQYTWCQIAVDVYKRQHHNRIYSMCTYYCRCNGSESIQLNLIRYQCTDL